jgi:hypothetical protein
MNALKTGVRCRAGIEEYRRVTNVIRMAALNNAILRAFIRVRDLPRRSDNVAKAGGRPDLKPIYETRLAMAQQRLRQFLEKVHPERFQKSDEQTFGNGNSPTRSIAYGRAAECPHGYGRFRATSLSGRERRHGLQGPNGVGVGPPKIVAP